MNVLGLTWSDAVGARFNGVSIKNHLADRNINYRLLTGSNPMLETNWISPAFPKRNESNPTFQFINNLEAQTGFQSRLQWWTSKLFQTIEYKQCEIVHLHIIHNGWFRLEILKRISREKKLVWTLHDPWILTGHCIYPYECLRWKEGCGSCPDLGRPLPVRRDRTKHEVVRKRKLLEEIDAHYVVSTNWFKNQLDTFGLQKNPISVIPFGIDTARFPSSVENRTNSRGRYLINENDFVVMIRVSTEPQKGLNTAIKAFSKLHEKIVIIAVDNFGKLNSLAIRHKILEFGWVHDETELGKLYGMADVFVMPSIAETFGLMALESMSCGTPVVYPRNTAIHEVVNGNSSFTYEEDGEGKNLSEVLTRLMRDKARLSRERKRVKYRADSEFNLDSYADKTAKMYQSTMEIA